MAWVVLAPSGTLSLLTSYSFVHLPSFIVQEVGPMNELLGEDVEVNFVAYGNADTQEVDGEYVFSCQVMTHCRHGTRGSDVRLQHGEDECYGNMVQACTQAHAPDYDTGLRWGTRVHGTRGTTERRVEGRIMLQPDSVHDGQPLPSPGRPRLLPGVWTGLSANSGKFKC